MVKSGILAAKLSPPIASVEALPMPRLDAIFERAIDRPATFFVAGAGFGKTTNVASFLQHGDNRFVWLTLDPLDREEGRVVDYLVAAFARLTGAEAWESSGRQGEVTPEGLADLFLSDLQERLFGRTIVVVDEFHQLGGPGSSAIRFFSHLLAFLPETVRLWIVARREPPIATQKLRNAGVVTTIDEEILRWSGKEVVSLSKILGRPLGRADADSLAEITGGRAATIRTILENFTHGGIDARRIAELAKNPSVEIRRYIEEEVVRVLPEKARHALLLSSIPEEIDLRALAEAAKSDTFESDLDELQRSSALLRPAGNPESSRLDPVVRGVVLRLAKTELGHRKVAAIQVALSDIYLRRGELQKAVLALVEAGAQKRAADILQESAPKLLREGRISTIRELAELLPQELIDERPQLHHALARSYLVEGRFAEANEQYLQLAKKKKLDPSLKAWVQQGLCEVAHRTHRLEDAAKHSRLARELIDRADPYCKAKILNDAGILALRNGDYELAKQEWERALALSFDPNVAPDFQKSVLHNLGLPTAATGQVRAAKSYFERLVEGDPESLRSQKAVALLNLARIALMQGDLESAERQLETALQTADKLNLHKIRAETMELFGMLFRRRGEFDRSVASLDHAALIYSQIGVDPSLEEIVDEQANLELARGNFLHAESLISSLVKRRRTGGNELALVTPLLTHARVLLALERREEAIPVLSEAIEIARRWNMRYQLAELLVVLSRATNDKKQAKKAMEEARELAESEGYDFGPATEADLPSVTVAVEERADLSARLFGAPVVRGDLGEAAWPLKKALAIFCHLATSPGFSASKDHLVDLFWGEDDLDVIERNFHPTISFLRRSLRGVTSAGKNFIQFSGGRYRLDPRYHYQIDVHEFTTVLSEAQTALRAGDLTKAVEKLDQALTLHSAPFMDGFYESWVLGRRTQHAEELRRVGTSIAAKLLESSDTTAVLFLSSRLRDVDPFDEKVAQLEMKAFAVQGDANGVKASFARLEETLRAELDQAPSAATKRLFAELSSASGSGSRIF